MRPRLLSVHAHPDDESSKGAGTLAHYRRLGAEVMVLSCTGGELGDLLYPDLGYSAWVERDIAGARRMEMEAARQVLDIEHRWLGYRDSGLPEAGELVSPLCFAGLDLETCVQPLVRLVREYRPHVMITYDEAGGYPHPDHLRCHEISVLAFDLAANLEYKPELGQDWGASKLYYDQIFNYPRVRAIREYLQATGKSPELLPGLERAMERLKERPYRANCHIDVSEELSKRDQALKRHASQVPPESVFFFQPHDLIRQTWPYEDFILAKTRVAVAREENDLFAGVVLET